MILHTNDSPTYSSQALVQQEFKISASAKAFKILSANLYSNKPRAIIRELSANAADAHTAAGHPERQFLVHMPSALDPILWIRDFGIGLAHDQVMSLYTTYFESTKADSNDYIGALGLGSKSPFAYVDSFTVTSFYNGTKTIYDMSLKGGVPNVAVLFSGPTDEENGLQVSMSVNDNDINVFRREAAYVYSTFAVKPAFAGLEVDCSFGESFNDQGTYFTTLNRFHRAGLYAVMGNIVYPIDTNQTGCGNVLSIMGRNNAFFVRFGLGELDIAPSREELSYDPHTLAAIKDRIENLETVVLGDTLEKYKDVTCPRVAYQMAQREPHGLRDIVMSRVMIDNKNITGWSGWMSWSPYSNIHRQRIRYREMRVWQSGQTDTKWRGKNSWNSDDLASINRESIKIFVNDDKKSPLQTIRALIANGTYNANDRLYVFDTKDNPAAQERCDLLIEMWRGKADVVYNSKQDQLRKDWAKDNKAADPTQRARTGPKANCELMKYSTVSGWSTEKVQMYAEDIKEYEGHFVRKYFDEYVNKDEQSLMHNDNLMFAYLEMRGITEVLIVRKGQWNLADNNEAMVDLGLEMIESVAQFSGRQIGRKSSISGGSVPTWISRLTAKLDVEHRKQFLPARRFYQTHKAQPFFERAVNDGRFISHLDKDAKKQLMKYKGTKAAMDRSLLHKYNAMMDKYPMICCAIEDTYGDIDHFLPEIYKILK